MASLLLKAPAANCMPIHKYRDIPYIETGSAIDEEMSINEIRV